MNTSIEQMLSRYNVESAYDKKNTMKEIMQEIVLCGLSKANFFERVAFYGGTALRVFHGLSRFSEDMDFSLIETDLQFSLEEYFPVLKKEVQSFGLKVTITDKSKTKASNIRSAFLKGNTREHLLLFYADEEIAKSIAKNKVIKIKFEVDIQPPRFATFEHRYNLLPTPYEVNLYDMPSLFAGKIHAILCRPWKNRMKGRDLYDYVFYLAKRTKLNRIHLRERLINSDFIPSDSRCTLNEVKKLLEKRFDSIDYAQAKQDVIPLIHDTSALDVWNADFFKQITQVLQDLE